MNKFEEGLSKGNTRETRKLRVHIVNKTGSLQMPKKLCLGNTNFSNSCCKDAKTLSIYRSLNVILHNADH